MKFQQRAHLVPVAGKTMMATSDTEPRRSGPSVTLTLETFSISLRPFACERRRSRISPSALISISASRLFPIFFSRRSSSRSAKAASRILKICFHSSNNGAGSSEKISAGAGNCARCTEASRPSTLGRYSQISSAVNERMGATSLTKVSEICHSTVCAERRSWLVGAKVYIRSLSTSR